jgi:hypothetical protein
MLCAGCVIVIANVIVDSFMQTYVPPDILGRVISATWAVMFAMMPTGALLAGVLATALGVQGRAMDTHCPDCRVRPHVPADSHAAPA